ncbi:MAG TPA: prepilin-type N-terminal cleavage/methylation domain-containing protein [Candidatus Saccharimonadales bacterium]|nr:prepilin-type N-terminal cleavage/methylation domain-containing protein [Candidatus Saccharimonadales bacterium]
MIKSKSGFTIVELSIVIIVIGILAMITAAAYGSTQAKARDAKRMSDLAKIAEAIQLHRIKYGNDVQTGSGCGSGGNGNGWFNYAGGTYPNSTLSCLIATGYLDATFIDPSGCTTNGNNSSGSELPNPSCDQVGYTYMKYSCMSGGEYITHVYARLETKDESQKLIDANTCSSATVANNYGMNYMAVAD